MDKELRAAKIKVTRRALVLALGVIAVTVGMLLGWAYFQRVNAAVHQAELAPLRQLLIEAVRNTKTDAPVEPRTGDIYFPQAGLYVPNTSSHTQLTYAYNKDDGADLSIASKTVLNQGITSLYNARNFYDLFSKLPYLQACQRGVTVSYTQTNESEKELRGTVNLNNGKTAYLYIERACPELGETVDMLKNLKAY